MDKPVARVRVNEDGVVAVEVNLSPAPNPEDLVATHRPDDTPDGDVLGRIKGARPPRWVELAGG